MRDTHRHTGYKLGLDKIWGPAISPLIVLQEWMDKNLAWNNSEMERDFIELTPTDIWTPSLVNTNRSEHFLDIFFDQLGD